MRRKIYIPVMLLVCCIVTATRPDGRAFLNALLSFVIIAAVVFFLVIKPVNSLPARLGMAPKEEPMRDCPECLSKVPAAAPRCAYCTTQLAPAAPASTTA